MKLILLPQFHMGDWEGDKPRKDLPFYQGPNKTISFFINNIVYILSFLIPFTVLLINMVFRGFSPFGDNSMFVLDASIIHLPLLQQTNISLHNHALTLFDLASGTELFSSWCYYLMSPFTLITLLFPVSFTVPLLSLLSVLRISFSGFSMSWYLTHRPLHRKSSKYNGMVLLFSIGYALSSTILIQYSDFMFIDHFMLFPLFILGVEELMENKKSRLFLFTAVYCLYSQFILGLAMLLFSVLYATLSDSCSLKKLYHLCKRILLSILLSAFTVIPGLYGVLRVRASFSDASFIINPFDLFLMMLPVHAPSYATTAGHGSNLFSGSVILILSFLHFFDKTLPASRRFRDFLLTVITFITLCQSQLIYVITSGNITDSSFLPYSFFFTFLLLLFSFESFPNLRKQSLRSIIFTAVLPVIACMLAINFSSGTPRFASSQLAVTLLLAYSLLFIVYRIGSLERKSFQALLLAATLLELCYSSIFISSVISEEGETASAQMISPVFSQNSGESGRSELYNDTDGFENSQLGLFSRYQPNPLSGKADTDHALVYSPLEDAMAALGSVYCSSDLSELRRPNTEQYSLTASKNGWDEYRNPYAFPFYYSIPENDSAYNRVSESGTWFTQQNAIASLLGSDKPLYESVSFTPTLTPAKDHDITLVQLKDNLYTITTGAPLDNELKQYKIEITFTPEKDGDLFLYTKKPVHFGPVKAGEDYTYTYMFPQGGDPNSLLWFQAAYIDYDVLSALSDSLNDSRIEPSSFSSTSLGFNVNYSSDRMLVTALPADAPFEILIDGKSISPTSLNDYLAVSVPSGNHTIVFHLNTLPLICGMILTLLSVLTGIFVFILKKRKTSVSSTEDHVLDIVSHFLADNRIYVLAFILPFSILTIAMALCSCVPFGSSFTIFNGDGLTVEIPSVYNFRQLINGHFPTHTYLSGGGYNVVVRPTSILLHLIYCIFPDQYILPLVTIGILFKLSFSSLHMVFYLTHRCKEYRASKHDPMLLIAGLCFSLCNYMLVLVNYFGWFWVISILPLILLAQDQLMCRNKKRWYVGLLAVSLLLNYYITMFICFYLVIRFFTYSFKNVKDFLRKGITFGICSLSTGLLAYNVLHMGTSSLSASTYGETDSVKPVAHWFNSFWYLIRQQGVFASTEPVSWNQGYALLYVGMLPLCLVFLYLFSNKPDLKAKLRKLLPLCLLYITLNHSVLNYLFNGLHYPNGVPNRFAFLIPFMCAEISYDALVCLPKTNIKRISLSFIIPAILLIVAQLYAGPDNWEPISLEYSILFIILYAVFTLVGTKQNSLLRLSQNIILLILCLELSANCIHVFNSNKALPECTTYERDAAELLYHITDYENTLDRASVISPVCSNYPFVTGLRSMQSLAGGSITPIQINMARYGGMTPYANIIEQQSTTTPMGSALMDNAYIIVHDSTVLQTANDFQYLEPIGQTEHSIILKNTKNLPLAYYLPADLEEKTKEPFDTVPFWQTLSDSLLPGETLVNKYDLPLQEEDPSAEDYYTIEDIHETMMDINTHLHTKEAGNLYMYSNFFMYYRPVDQGEDLDLPITRQNTKNVDLSEEEVASYRSSMYYIIMHFDAFEKLIDKLCSHSLTIDSFDDKHISGTITAPEDGLVNFSLPYGGWNATVDGEPAETIMLAQAFLAVKVPAGTHKICLTTHVNYWTRQLIITIISWIVFLIGCLLLDMYNKRHPKEGASDVQTPADEESVSAYKASPDYEVSPDNTTEPSLLNPERSLKKPTLTFPALLALMILFGSVFILAWMALFGNASQSFTDIVFEYTAYFDSNKSTEIHLVFLLCLIGIIPIWLFIRNQSRKPINMMEKTGIESTQPISLLTVLIATIFITNYLFNNSLSAPLFALLLYCLISFLIPDKAKQFPGFILFITFFYGIYGLYRLYVFIGGVYALNLTVVSVLALILSVLFLLTKRTDHILRMISINELFIPLLLLVFLSSGYLYQDKVFTIAPPITIGIPVLLLIVICIAESALNLIRSYKKLLSFSNTITIGGCICIMAFQSFTGSGAVVPGDLHHPFENIIGFTQIFQMGQIPFSEYVPASGLFSVLHGALFQLLGHGLLQNYNICLNILYLIIVIGTILLLWKQLPKEYVLLFATCFYIIDYTRTIFILPLALLLNLPRLISKPNAWLKVWFLSSLFSGLYYPLYGAALLFAFMPFGIYQIISYHKSGLLKKDLKTVRFHLGWIICFIPAILSIPLLWGSVIQILAMKNQTIFADGLARFGQCIPESFLVLLPDSLRLAVYLILTFLMPALIIWFSAFLSLQHAQKNASSQDYCYHPDTSLLYLCSGILLLISMTYTMVRLDVNDLFSRSKSVIVIAVILFFLLLLKDQVTAAKKPILITCCFILCLFSGIGVLRLNDHAGNQPYTTVPDQYSYIENETASHIGTCFMDSTMLQEIEESGAFLSSYDRSQAYFALAPYYGYYYLHNIKGSSVLESLTVKGFDAAAQTAQMLSQNNAIVGSYIGSLGEYYLYHWLMTSGSYIWSDDMNAFLPNHGQFTPDEVYLCNKNAHIAPETLNMEHASSAFGNSLSSLNDLFTESEITSSIDQTKTDSVITFSQPVSGLDADFLYMEIPVSERQFEYILYGHDQLTVQDSYSPLRFLYKKEYNPGVYAIVSWVNESGETCRIRCNLAKGKLLIPLGAGKDWLLENHDKISVSIVNGNDQLSAPSISNLRLLKLREI